MNLAKNFFIKSKINHLISFGISSTGGRNFLGKICIHHRGSGNKKIYRSLDFFRRVNSFGVVTNIWKDSFRSAYIGSIFYVNGIISNIILCDLLIIGSVIFSGDVIFGSKSFSLGSCVTIKDITLFSVISNSELYPLSGSVLCRSAGTGCIIIGVDKKNAFLKLSSGWQLSVDKFSMACLGFISNTKHKYKVIKKAGTKRNLGIRPTVRGVAKNPCDHPHGGGEGKKSPPAAALSPWGWLTKGTPTTNKKFNRINRRLFKKFS